MHGHFLETKRFQRNSSAFEKWEGIGFNQIFYRNLKLTQTTVHLKYQVYTILHCDSS